MGRREQNWLMRELPGWLSEGIVDGATAERLRARYTPARPGRSWGMVICGVLGALLVGAGIILVLAHNWRDLSRPWRTALSFAPLVVMQALVVLGLARRWSGAAWRETTGLLWACTIGSSLALIGQTYHLPGDAESFTLWWALLALPVLALQQSVAVFALYLALLLAWASFSQLAGGVALWFWPLTALASPVLVAAVRRNPYSQPAVLMLWFLALAGTAALGITLEKTMPGLWMVIYAALFAVFYLLGGRWGAEGPTFWQRPLHSVGSFGTVILAYLLSFHWPWERVGWQFLRHDPAFHPLAAGFDYALALVLPLAAMGLLVHAARRGQAGRAWFGLFPVVAALGYLLAAGSGSEGLSFLLLNGYLLVLGLFTLVRGIRERRIGTVNAGMLTLIAQILTRFFDSSSSFVAKGLVFILLGTLFLVANLLISRRRREDAA